jgi:hypothetical protein
MAASTRQTNLLIQQDWKKIYQSFSNADFQSYDFETLRKSMVDYLRSYYPEDYNDFLESSEYVALIDLIAFLGQSLAFRTDLNARENFIDTAERRDSILKLARLINYVPKRNVPASGLLRIDGVTTTEALLDSNGINLSNIPISWNDSGNDNWLEQFNIILNAALISSQTVGKSGQTSVIGGVMTDEYSLNILPQATPVFRFSSTIENATMPFEVVSATAVGKTYIYERDPRPVGLINMLYRNDSLGNDSTNTGWFLYFKQGNISSLDFSVDQNLANRVISVNVDNINNDDIWLYEIDSAGNFIRLWDRVDSVNSTNVIYNTTTKRYLYQVNTRANDQIDLVFGDGAFADIPQGLFRLYYRTSTGLQYKITPSEMSGINIPITYVNRNNRTETLTVRASLYYTVNNATPRESLAEIKQKAPQQYYTQNRMITGEDYNIFPYTRYNSILKIKSTNRASSGISRYLDTLDVTGRYSSTNVFAADGILFRQETVESESFVPVVNGDVLGQLNDTLNNTLLAKNSVPFTQFIYAKTRRFTPQDADVNGSLLTVIWQQLTLATAQSTGYMALEADYLLTVDTNTGIQQSNQIAGNPLKTGSASSNSLRYLQPGTIIRFRATPDLGAAPKYFDSINEIKTGTPSLAGDKIYLYATVVNVTGDGTGGGILTATSQGPITLSTFVPTGAYVDQIIPAVSNKIPTAILNTAVTLINGKKNFGIRFDQIKQSWNIIQPQDLKLSQSVSSLINTDGINAEYSETYAGNTSSASLDSSWIMAFVSGVYGYNIYYRQINYIFESVQETKFYYDSSVRVYDSKTGTTLTDQIKVLRSNSQPDANAALYEDKTYYIYKMVIDPDGRENSNKILLKFADTSRAGVPDNPDLFEEIVNPASNSGRNKYVFFEQNYNNNNFVQYSAVSANLISVAYGSQGAIVQSYNLYSDGQIFFAYDENVFYVLSVTPTASGTNIRSLTAYPNGTRYLWLYGRSDLYFQYRHAAPANRRIDPAPNNILDLFILTTQYASDYQSWIVDTTNRTTQPLAPDTEALQLAYGELENYKTISDTIIYNSARFKPIIGNKADPALQATIKVVKNPNVVISDNEVKTLVISAINKYFTIDNWDFGETFYFSELGAYLHSELIPNISSIIIVPNSTSQQFGGLYQINAEPDEIIISCATVDNVVIIPAITTAQL